MSQHMEMILITLFSSTPRATPGTSASLIYKEECLCVCVCVPYRNPHQWT